MARAHGKRAPALAVDRGLDATSRRWVAQLQLLAALWVVHARGVHTRELPGGATRWLLRV